MQSEKNIEAYLKTANISEVSRETGISRLTLSRMQKGDFNVFWSSVKAVSKYMDKIFENQ